MKAFNGSQELKESLLQELREHQAADEFVRGAWLERISGRGLFRGCFYGCTMQTEVKPREAFSEKYSIDLTYCYITERIFEGLPENQFESFPVESIEIIPPGFDFEKAKSRFFWLLLEDQKRFVSGNVLKVVEDCQRLFLVPFNEIDKAEAYWSAKAAEARAAEARAARAAAYWSAKAAAEAAAYWPAKAAAEAYWAAEAASESELRVVRAMEAATTTAVSASVSRPDYYVFMKKILFQAINETK